MSRASTVTVMALLVLVVVLLFVGYRALDRLGDRMQGYEPLTLDSIQTVVSEEVRIRTMGQTLTASWKDSSGLTHTVTTPKNGNESPQEHAARHQALVAVMVELYPPA